MKYRFPHFPSLLLSLVIVALLSACGGGEKTYPDTIEGKKEHLADLQKQLTTITQQVTVIEQDIAKSDPNAAKGKKTAVTVIKLAPESLTHFVKVQGSVSSNKNVMVSPQAPGKILSVTVKEGQQVKAGDLLAQLDDNVLRKNMAQLQTGLDLARVIFNKQKSLWDKQIGTEIQYLQAESQVKSLEQQLAALESQADMYKITAPISGTIDMSNAKVGEYAAPGMPAFKIVNNNSLVIKSELAENYLPYVRRGDNVKIFFPTLNRDISVRLSRIGEEIHPMNRTFTVEAELPASSAFKPNMLGELSINDQNKSNAIVIPIETIQKGEDHDYVYIAVSQGGKYVAQRRPITLGLSQGDKVEVLTGLSSGDQLITTNLQDMAEGQEVGF